MKTQYDALMSDPEFRKLYAVEGLVTDASEMISRLMTEQEMSKADLARKLGKSRAWVTQLLSGKANVTVRTLAEVAFALGGRVKLSAEPEKPAASRKFFRSGSTIYVEQPELVYPPSPREVFTLKNASVNAGAGEDRTGYAA
jgi:transcriptional regulator with XRE-family HTH domain